MNAPLFDGLMRKALTNDLDWQLATATPEQQDAARDWLRDRRLEVNRDIQVRRYDFKEIWLEHGPLHSLTKNAGRDYYQWKKKAIWFRALVIRREQQLNPTPIHAPATKTPGSCGKHEEMIARQLRHADYMQRQNAQVSASLFALADAVAGFNDGEIDGPELVKLLDTLTVPHAGDGVRSLQEVLDEMAVKAEREEQAAA